MIPQEADGLFQLGGELPILAVHNWIDIFVPQDFQQRTRRAAGAGTESASDFRRQVAEHGDKTFRIGGKRVEKMAVRCGPWARSEIRTILVKVLLHSS